MTSETVQDGPSRNRLALQIGGAFVVAGVITVLVVLPAEYGVDPTGFGALTGLDRLATPPEIVVETRAVAPPEIASLSETPFRSDAVTIRVGGLSENFGELEYKVTMPAGEAMVYSWTAPEPIYYEFHGHTTATPDRPQIEVMDYIAATAREAHGTLIAPIDGIHGWYFRNPGYEPIEVELRMSGYYELEPGIIGLH